MIIIISCRKFDNNDFNNNNLLDRYLSKKNNNNYNGNSLYKAKKRFDNKDSS